MIRFDELQELALKAANFRDRHVVQCAARSDVNAEDLFFRGERRVLILLQDFREALAARELRLRDFVELIGTELRESGEFAVLRHVQAQSASHLAHGLDLGVAADAADGDAYVDGRTNAAVEKVGFEGDLAVGDGDDVGRNIGRNVAGLRFNHGQRGQRTAPEFIVELRGALQQARMEIDNVAWKSFAARWAAQEQRDFAISLGVFGEVVIEGDSVTLGVAEEFAHGARGVGRDVLERRRLGGARGDDDSVVHGAGVGERLHDLGDRGAFLADAAVDANEVPAPLIDNSVEDHGGLAGLAVADNQFALAAADRNHRIDGLDTGLERLADGLAVEHAGSNALERVALPGSNGAFAVERLPERIDDAADESFAHGHGHNRVGALDDVALFELGRLAEKHGADFSFFEVERDAENVVGKREHLASHGFFESIDARDAVTHTDDRADFVDGNGLLVVFDLLAQNLADFVC